MFVSSYYARVQLSCVVSTSQAFLLNSLISFNITNHLCRLTLAEKHYLNALDWYKSPVNSDLEAFPLRLLQPYTAQLLDLLFTAIQPNPHLEVVPAAVLHSQVEVHPQQPVLLQREPSVLAGQEVRGLPAVDAELEPREDLLASLGLG